MSLLLLVPLAPCCNFTAVDFNQQKVVGGKRPLLSAPFFLFLSFLAQKMWWHRCSECSVITAQIKIALLSLLINGSAIIVWSYLNLSYMDRSKVNPWDSNWCSCHWCLLQTLWKRILFTDRGKHLMSLEWGQSYWPWYLMLLKAFCRNQAT